MGVWGGGGGEEGGGGGGWEWGGGGGGGGGCARLSVVVNASHRWLKRVISLIVFEWRAADSSSVVIQKSEPFQWTRQLSFVPATDIVL